MEFYLQQAGLTTFVCELYRVMCQTIIRSKFYCGCFSGAVFWVNEWLDIVQQIVHSSVADFVTWILDLNGNI